MRTAWVGLGVGFVTSFVLAIMLWWRPSAPLAAIEVAPPQAPLAMKVHRTAPPREPIAPWSLTASDGTGLELEAIDAKAVVEGPLAFTELHLRFRNPEDRVREGTFAITLPIAAAVSRFAMKEDNRFKEAEVVKKEVARRAYDDALHHNIDPAILEKGTSNQFTARVFPIPARGVKELVISYSQELAGAGYLLPLAGLPTIDEVAVSLDTRATDGTHHSQELHEQHWQPDHDFFADVEASTGVASRALVAAAFAVEPADGATADTPTALMLLVDTSASRAPGFRGYVDHVRAFVAGLAAHYPALAVQVVAFDQVSDVIYDGPASGFADAQVGALIERRAEGASDVGQALARVHAGARLAIITDGVITAGVEGAPLAQAVRKLAPARVDVILAGGIRDEHVAKLLVRVGTRPGDIFDFDSELAPIEEGLGQSVQIDVPVAVAGASWFYPHTLASVRAGTQVMVYAQLGAESTRMTASFAGEPETVDVQPGTPALVERATARARIDDLEDQLVAATTESAKTALREQIETRSIASRVVSSQATMLVLDNDAQYEHYGIDRKALADILVVGPNGLEQQHRTYVASREPTRDARLSREDAIAAARSQGLVASAAYGTISTGAYGTVGRGGGTGAGYGIGYGSMRGRTAAVPMVSVGAAVVEGSLDTSIIRRYVKRNLGSIKYCYERELQPHPQLHGTVTAHFVVGPNGRVESSSATGVDDRVATCVAGVIAKIEFPAAATTDIVIVNYPFTFRSPNTPPDPPDPVLQAIAGSASSSQPAAGSSAAQVPAATAAPTASATRGGATTVTSGPLARDAAIARASETSADRIHSSATTLSQEASAQQAGASEPVRAAPVPAVPDIPRFDPAASALRGKLAKVMHAISAHDVDNALALAHAWRDEQPTDALAIVALGEAKEAAGDRQAAARVYGSLIDLYPTRADYRRFAGERLERLGGTARSLAIDTYRRAVADRPDQITGHRLLAYALLRAHDYAGAFAAVLAGVDEKTPEDRYAGAARVFARDASMIATTYLAHGGDHDHILKALAKRGLEPFTDRSTRVLLYWETDANDVDLHVRDSRGGHSWYSHKQLESGGELYADITTGFGPECFEIVGTPGAGPYDLGVHYYRQGPMGYGMGLVEIETFDGKDFTFEDRPYVIMQDEAYVSLGKMP